MSAREEKSEQFYIAIGYRMTGELAKYEAIATMQPNAGDAYRSCNGGGFHVVAVVRPDERAPGGIAFPVMCHTKHEPSPQTHVAAGPGWRERVLKLRENFSRALSACYDYGSDDNGEWNTPSEIVEFDALLDEVVEIPEAAKQQSPG